MQMMVPVDASQAIINTQQCGPSKYFSFPSGVSPIGIVRPQFLCGTSSYYSQKLLGSEETEMFSLTSSFDISWKDAFSCASAFVYSGVFIIFVLLLSITSPSQIFSRISICAPLIVVFLKYSIQAILNFCAIFFPQKISKLMRENGENTQMQGLTSNKRQNNEWICKCGRLYSSYPSLYQHMKKKHPLIKFTRKSLNQQSNGLKCPRGRPTKYMASKRIEQILHELSDGEKYFLTKIKLPYIVDQQFEGDRSLINFMREIGSNEEIKHLILHFCWEIKQAVFSHNIILPFWASNLASFPLFANYISHHWNHKSVGIVRVEILNKLLEVYCRWLFEKHQVDLRVNLIDIGEREVGESKKMGKIENQRGQQQERIKGMGEEQIEKYLCQFD